MFVLVFWGLTRSLRYTISSIETYILNVLKSRNIPYKIVMHTYRLSTPYTNSRARENNIMLDNDEYTLLNPDKIIIEDQDTVKSLLGLHEYRTHPDPWNSHYQTVDNFVLAMYSKMKATQLAETYSPSSIIFLRPDVQYITPLPLLTIKHDQIIIPDFHLYQRMNDRFAICTEHTYKIYGNIFPILLSYSKQYPLHSETCYAKYLLHNKIRLRHIPFYFIRIRANGETDKRDYSIRSNVQPSEDKHDSIV